MSIVEGLLDVFHPPSCAACGRLGAEPFCGTCAEALLPAEPFTVAGAAKALAVFTFGGPVAEAIHHFKYHDRPDLGRPLGRSMRPALERFAPFDLVVAMPPSRGRLVARGYDPARELVRGLSLRPDIDALLRVTEPPAQVGLDRDKRLANLTGAFAADTRRVTGRNVLLVDDVVTTGATAEAATAALSSAASVQVLALAHTP